MTDLVTQAPARAERERARRRMRRMRRIIAWLALAGLAGGGTFLATRPRGAAKSDDARGGSVRLRTTLVAMTVADDPSGQADSLTIFSARADGSRPVRLFMPSGTLAPIPGQGFEPLARTLGVRDQRLLELSVENLTGLRIDQTLVVDDVSLGRVVDALGGVEVNVPETLTEIEDGVSEQVAAQGIQRMDGATALTYMTYRGGEQTELTRFVRAQAVFDAMAFHGRKALEGATAKAEPAGATNERDLRALAGVLTPAGQPSGTKVERANLVLPVEPAGGSGTGELYRMDDDRADAYLRSEMEGALISLEVRLRLELRNGNGTPQIGERVAALLVPEGFAIEVSGNAPSFTEPRTRIIIYEDTSETRERAAAIRVLLGVGRIELGTRAQSVVDMTVVIGRDLKGKA